MDLLERINETYQKQCFLYTHKRLELVIEMGGEVNRVIYLALDDLHIGIVSENDYELLSVFDQLNVPIKMLPRPPYVVFDGTRPESLQLPGAWVATMKAADLFCSLILQEIGVTKTIPKVSIERVLDKVPSLTKGPRTYRTSEIK